MNKDLGIAIAAAKQVEAPLILSQVASGVYGRLAKDDGYTKLDFSVVYTALSQKL